MPKRATYHLRWQPQTQQYAVFAGEAPVIPMVIAGDPAWLRWLSEVSSFAFVARSGATCTVRKEAVQRGGDYWFAYRRVQGRMAKRYLGRSAGLTPARLEEVAMALAALTQADGVPMPAAPVAVAEQPATHHQPPEPTPGETIETADTRRMGARQSSEAVPLRASHLLLTTKLQMPRATAQLVNRPAISQRLDRGLERPLTLLTAPAGFGKTMALCAWGRQQSTPLAWVSLDAGDNDASQFWMYTLAALNRAIPGVADTALAMVQSPQAPPLAVALRALLNAIAAQPQEVILILDDYHLITEPAIHESVALLLEHPPAQLHLYLATRNEPSLPLARLRARDQVNELRADDLRFRSAEVATFFSDVMGIRLAERTDGWIAGLQLAGLSLQQHADPVRFIATFSGSHRHILTYLGEEVLAAQPEDVQTFLLQTSILGRMCAPLCDALTGRSDGQAMLERLEQANLFLVALDDESRWYRYYHLFADLLRYRLRQQYSDLIPDLHRRAARWLEVDGWVAEAVNHLFAVPDIQAAAQMIERAAQGFTERGELVTLLRLIERLPEEVIAARPRLAIAQANVLFARGSLEMAEQRLTEAEHALQTNAPQLDEQQDEMTDTERRTLAGSIAGDRAVLAAMHGETTQTLRYAEEALALLPADDLFSRSGVLLAQGNGYRNNNELRAADATYSEAVRLGRASGNIFIATIALNMQADLCVQQGRLRQAVALSRQVIELSEARGGDLHMLTANTYNFLSGRFYEWNDLAAAESASERAIALAEQWGNTEHQIEGYSLLAFVYQARGETAAAREAVQRAERLIQLGRHFPWGAIFFGMASVRLALQQGRVEEAQQWLSTLEAEIAQYSTSITPFQDWGELTRVRVLLAPGAQAALDEAATLLARQAARARAEERLGDLIDIMALQSLLHQAQDEPQPALASLEQALTLAASEGYLRLFVDHGQPMRALLLRLREKLPKGHALRPYIEQLLAAFDHPFASKPAQPAEQAALVEPLSDREREVLYLLAQGHSNQQMARQLVVAVSTIKTHVHHIFAKLQASDRLQAVNRARELGLLDR